MTTFENMTNAELKEACKDFGLEVIAKNPAKPNKEEYLRALNEFKASQDKLHGVEPEVETKETVETTETKAVTPKPKPQSKQKLMKLDLLKKDRVIIHDQQESQTKDEMISVAWGNLLIGGQQDWVDVGSSEPQYVRRGALNNLREATTVTHVAKGSGAAQVRKKRFIIVDAEPLTENEFEDLKTAQKMRNSKLA